MIIFGTTCIDRIYRIPALPKPGGFVEVVSELDSLGGEAANTASYLRKWGADAALAANPVGDDDDGRKLSEMLQQFGYEQPMVTREFRTPVCEVLVTPDGERTMIGRGFSALSAAHVSLPTLTDGEWFTADPNFGQAARNAVRQAQAAGMKTYLMDFYQDYDAPLIEACMAWQSGTDWVGERNANDKNIELLQAMHAKHGPRPYVLTDGANGVIYCDVHGVARHQPAPKSDGVVVDATGSGDAFRAGMLYGLAHSWPLEQCVKIGSAAGYLNCKTLGSTRGIPTLDEVLEVANA